MKKLVFLALAATALQPALAVDNLPVIDAASATRTIRYVDIGGILYNQTILADTLGANILGDVTASPAANTIGARLKTINETLNLPLLCSVTTAAPSYVNGTNNYLNCDTAGGLRVSGAGGGGGSVTVTSSALPTGAATSAKQPALGTAGTPSADVITIQGASAGTAVKTQGGAADGAAVAGNPDRIAGKDQDGNTQDILTDRQGILASPYTGACDATGTNGCRETRTQMNVNTSQTICPAVASPNKPISQEIYFTFAGIGVSFSGATLTGQAVGTSLTTSPTYEYAAAGVVYTFPVPQTNAITAYTAVASPGIAVCVQKWGI